MVQAARRAGEGATARGWLVVSALMLPLAMSSCADKYELEPYQISPGDHINSEGRADPGTFHFLADGGAHDGLATPPTADGDLANGTPDATVGRRAVDASDGEGATGPGRLIPDAATGEADVASEQDAGPDAEDGAAADVSVCGHGACVQAADCGVDLAGGGACSLALCVGGCCELAAAPPGSSCDDKDPCTINDQCQIGGCAGTATVCDDGLMCTTDQCNAIDGTCVHTINAGNCKIDGVCQVANESAPGLACLWCDPKLAATDWSKKPGCCMSDLECPHGGVCELAKCDLTTGECGFEKKNGCCDADVQCDDANACTVDTCAPATGKCSIVPKACADPTACQQGLCDPKSGLCITALKQGYCIIGFQCVTAGEKSPGQPCASCQPKSKTDGYTVDVGALCDDSDSCTEADTCQPDGSCMGKAQAGCCKSDQDCQPAPSPCVTRKCNVGVGVCTSETKQGCCDKGVCCDLGKHTIKAAGSKCADVVVGSQYKCDGQAIVRRDSHPGCTGQGALSCSSDPAHVDAGPWQTVSVCGSGTACKTAGSGVKPQCVPTGPVGSCGGACGGKTKSVGGTCYCDGHCAKLGDCCGDFMKLCGCSAGPCCDVAKKYPKSKGLDCGVTVKSQYQCAGTQLQKRTAQGTCDGVSAGCSTVDVALKWSAWATQQTCPANTKCTVGGGGSSGKCVPKPSDSCSGKCGGQSGACWCDNDCVKYGDCCGDFMATCACGANGSKTCKGGCSGKGVGGCWCDALCVDFGDCCPDKPTCCA